MLELGASVLKPPAINHRVVLEDHAPLFLVLVEKLFSCGEHWFISWLAGVGHVGGGEQPPLQGWQVEVLKVRQSFPDRLAAEKLAHCRSVHLFVIDLCVIGGKAVQQLFVITKEWRRFSSAVIP